MIRFRLALVSDCEDLSRLINSAYRGESSRAGWTTEADLLDGQRTDPASLRDLLVSDAVILMAFEDGGGVEDTGGRDGRGAPGFGAESLATGELVGCVFLENKKDHAYVGMLTVSPSAQASGLGKNILAYAESWAAKNWRVGRIELTVIIQRTELIAWYVRRGYHETGRREPFPADEKFGKPKVPDLELVAFEKKI
jgi:ribosomal protein S18 acetylase RimI-like enzyme